MDEIGSVNCKDTENILIFLLKFVILVQLRQNFHVHAKPKAALV